MESAFLIALCVSLMQGDPHSWGAEGPLDMFWGGAARCPQVDSGMRWRVWCFGDIAALRDVLGWAVASPQPSLRPVARPPRPFYASCAPGSCGPGAAGAREGLLRARAHAAGGCAPESWVLAARPLAVCVCKWFLAR